MFKLLGDFQKFQPGSNLWILFHEPNRELFKQINWRTGFLLEGIKSRTAVSKPVLIDTHTMFPNWNLVCLPFEKKSWLSDAYALWGQLRRPSLRVFVPLKGNGEKLNQDWPSSDLLYNLSYYVEKKNESSKKSEYSTFI